MAQYIEQYVPIVKFKGLNTNKAATFGSTVSISGAATFNGGIIGSYSQIVDNQNQVSAANYATSHTVYVNDNVSGTYKLVAVSAVFGTASTSGTLNVEVATGTQAIASGTNQMSSTISLSGTANTVVNGTITTQTTISAGARLNLIFGGTVTNLANASVVLSLQKIS